MNFIRKKIKGQNQKVRRTWMSEDKYRIVWRSEAFGIELPAAFQATVRIILPTGGEMWDFVSSRRLFKTLKAAQEACEKHQRLWTQAAEGYRYPQAGRTVRQGSIRLSAVGQIRN